MSNLQRVKQIVDNVNAWKIDTKEPNKSKFAMDGNFTGKMGVNVFFTGHWLYATDRPSGNPNKYASEEIRLLKYNYQFATIKVKNGFTHNVDKRNQVPATVYQVFSPKYQQESGHLGENIEATNQLQVFCGPNETADSVLDEICDTIAYSKACFYWCKKFGLKKPSLSNDNGYTI